jgi:hypothetical protein
MPLTDLLRDVQLALETSAVSEAEWLITLLRRRGELDSQNLFFLDLRLLAASGRWSEIVQHPRIDDALNARRPVAVTAMLFEALDAVFLAGPAAAKDASEALSVYRARIAEQFVQLVRSGPDINTTPALQVSLLAAVANGATRAGVLDVAKRADASARPWFETIAQLAPESAPVAQDETAEADRVQLARDALYSGDDRHALELLEDQAPEPQIVELLVAAAIGADSLASAQIVASKFAELHVDDQAKVRNQPLLTAPLEKLLSLAGDGQSVHSWSQWIARLNADRAFKAPLEVAERGAVEWPTKEPTTHAEAGALAAALTGVREQAGGTLERALPHLLAYLARRPQPDDIALPVHRAILEVLAYGDSRSRTVREAASTVLTRLLDAGPAAAAYEEELGLVENIWDDARAASTLGWLADVLVAVVHYPCPSPAARAALIRRALADAVTLRDADPFVRDLLLTLATDPVLDDAFAAEVEAINQASDIPDGTTSSEGFDPGPRVVGIYSLSEPSARRAKTVLEGRFPTLDIQLNHEHDDSERLRGLARRADIMAVVIASAKHAATDAIRRHCASDTLLEVGTAGSTGLIRAVVGRLQELVAA